MNILAILAIVGPIITELIPLAEKMFGKKTGKKKKTWVVKQLAKKWEELVAAGVITGDAAKVPVQMLLLLASNLIDALIGVANTTPVKPIK